jgi:hypothetical protein
MSEKQMSETGFGHFSIFDISCFRHFSLEHFVFRTFALALSDNATRQCKQGTRGKCPKLVLDILVFLSYLCSSRHFGFWTFRTFFQTFWFSDILDIGVSNILISGYFGHFGFRTF